MSKMTLTYIPLERPKPSGGIPVNHVRVSVYYYKGRGIILSAGPCEVSDGFVKEALHIGGGGCSIYRCINPMSRGNARVEAAYRETILKEIEAKSGPYWDEIEQLIAAVSEPQAVAV